MAVKPQTIRVSFEQGNADPQLLADMTWLRSNPKANVTFNPIGLAAMRTDVEAALKNVDVSFAPNAASLAAFSSKIETDVAAALTKAISTAFANATSQISALTSQITAAAATAATSRPAPSVQAQAQAGSSQGGSSGAAGGGGRAAARQAGIAAVARTAIRRNIDVADIDPTGDSSVDAFLARVATKQDEIVNSSKHQATQAIINPANTRDAQARESTRLANFAIRNKADLSDIYANASSNVGQSTDEALKNAADAQFKIQNSPEYLAKLQVQRSKLLADFEEAQEGEFLAPFFGGRDKFRQGRAARIAQANPEIGGLEEDLLKVKKGKLFSEKNFENLKNPETLQQIGFGAIFGATAGGPVGGVLGLAGTAAGALAGGAPGALLASTALQTGSVLINALIEPIKAKVGEFKEAGDAFAHSILSISAVLQNASQINASTNVGAQLKIQEERATDIQLTARGRLSKLGVGGETEATLVSSVVSGLSQRGLRATPEQIAKISEGIGATELAQQPQLLENQARNRRDIEGLLSGSKRPNTLTQLIGSETRASFGRAGTAEDFAKAVDSLQGFVLAVKASDNIVALERKEKGARENIAVAGGNAFNEAIKPAVAALVEALQSEDVKNVTATLGTVLGTVTGAFTYLEVGLVNLTGVVGRAGSAIGEAISFIDDLIPGRREQKTIDAAKAGYEKAAAINSDDQKVGPVVENLLDRAGLKDKVAEYQIGFNKEPRGQLSILEQARALLLAPGTEKSARDNQLPGVLSSTVKALEDVNKENRQHLDSLGGSGAAKEALRSQIETSNAQNDTIKELFNGSEVEQFSGSKEIKRTGKQTFEGGTEKAVITESGLKSKYAELQKAYDIEISTSKELTEAKKQYGRRLAKLKDEFGLTEGIIAGFNYNHKESEEISTPFNFKTRQPVEQSKLAHFYYGVDDFEEADRRLKDAKRLASIQAKLKISPETGTLNQQTRAAVNSQAASFDAINKAADKAANAIATERQQLEAGFKQTTAFGLPSATKAGTGKFDEEIAVREKAVSDNAARFKALTDELASTEAQLKTTKKAGPDAEGLKTLRDSLLTNINAVKPQNAVAESQLAAARLNKENFEEGQRQKGFGNQEDLLKYNQVLRDSANILTDESNKRRDLNSSIAANRAALDEFGDKLHEAAASAEEQFYSKVKEARAAGVNVQGVPELTEDQEKGLKQASLAGQVNSQARQFGLGDIASGGASQGFIRPISPFNQKADQDRQGLEDKAAKLRREFDALPDALAAGRIKIAKELDALAAKFSSVAEGINRAKNGENVSPEDKARADAKLDSASAGLSASREKLKSNATFEITDGVIRRKRPEFKIEGQSEESLDPFLINPITAKPFKTPTLRPGADKENAETNEKRIKQDNDTPKDIATKLDAVKTAIDDLKKSTLTVTLDSASGALMTSSVTAGLNGA